MIFFFLVLFQCGFEEGELFCSFVQDTTDSTKIPGQPGESFDWEQRCGPTPTQDTGPDSGAQGSQCFAFIETSDPQRPNDTARSDSCNELYL